MYVLREYQRCSLFLIARCIQRKPPRPNENQVENRAEMMVSSWLKN